MTSDDRSGLPALLLGATEWRRSSASGQLGNCVEVAVLDDGGVAVRNSHHPGGPALVGTPAEWSAFLTGAQRDEFALDAPALPDPPVRRVG